VQKVDFDSGKYGVCGFAAMQSYQSLDVAT